MTDDPRPVEGRCGFTIIDKDGLEQPCDRPATGWRWYQDCDHEDTLDVACDRHENEGGRRLAAADRENAELRGELAGIPSSPDYSGAESCCWSPKHHTLHQLAAERDDLRAQLAAAQAQLAEARAWLAKAEPYPDLNGNHFVGLAAALSVAPQPEPEPLPAMVKCIYTASRWHPAGVCCATAPAPPASDEPARCEP